MSIEKNTNIVFLFRQGDDLEKESLFYLELKKIKGRVMMCGPLSSDIFRVVS